MTKEQVIQNLKKTYPIIKTGSDEIGYTELNDAEYEVKISEWADQILLDEKITNDNAIKKAAAEAKLAALGLTADDLKALGLA